MLPSIVLIADASIIFYKCIFGDMQAPEVHMLCNHWCMHNQDILTPKQRQQRVYSASELLSFLIINNYYMSYTEKSYLVNVKNQQ